jgi:hypothetical protein
MSQQPFEFSITLNATPASRRVFVIQWTIASMMLLVGILVGINTWVPEKSRFFLNFWSIALGIPLWWRFVVVPLEPFGYTYTFTDRAIEIIPHYGSKFIESVDASTRVSSGRIRDEHINYSDIKDIRFNPTAPLQAVLTLGDNRTISLALEAVFGKTEQIIFLPAEDAQGIYKKIESIIQTARKIKSGAK